MEVLEVKRKRQSEYTGGESEQAQVSIREHLKGIDNMEPISC